MKWIHRVASICDEYIYMPQDDAMYREVGEYTARGFLGCIGSVNCVHIGWDPCPTQYTNLYTDKEGFASIAYEVICTSRKFIQSITVGHPGTRNDKHIVRTDATVTDLLYGNGWLNLKNLQCCGPDGGEFQNAYRSVPHLSRRLPLLAVPHFTLQDKATCQAAPLCVGPLL